MDAHRTQITPLFSEVYGPTNTVKWWAYWRVFFMACAELFGYRGGTEWMVFHYLFEKPAATLR
jgi:cyclopropane-fatty-acyl-phospholipid synthase